MSQSKGNSRFRVLIQEHVIKPAAKGDHQTSKAVPTRKTSNEDLMASALAGPFKCKGICCRLNL